jgi:hypothetical protein
VSALQKTLLSFLDPAYTLAGVVLLCMYTECAARVQSNMDVSIDWRVLLTQLGQSLMVDIDYALTVAAASPRRRRRRRRRIYSYSMIL